jgi:hypothetical protein
MSNIKDENELIEYLRNKKNIQNEKFKNFLNEKIKSMMNNDNIIKNMEKEIEEECIILDSIIELIEKKNKEIVQLKSYSIFDIQKYNSIVSI